MFLKNILQNIIKKAFSYASSYYSATFFCSNADCFRTISYF